MTRSRAKAIQQEVNSLLSTLTLNSPLDGMLPHANMLCVIRYEPREKYVAGDTKLDTEDGEEEYQLKDAPQGRHCRPPGTGIAGLLTPALPASRPRHCRPLLLKARRRPRPALPAQDQRHCQPHRHCQPQLIGTTGPTPVDLISTVDSSSMDQDNLCNAHFTPVRIWTYKYLLPSSRLGLDLI